MEFYDKVFSLVYKNRGCLASYLAINIRDLLPREFHYSEVLKLCAFNVTVKIFQYIYP